MNRKNPKPTAPPARSVTAAAIAGVLLLILGGTGFRGLDRELNSTGPIKLAQPLSALSLDLGDWQGTELQMNERVLEVAGCDDYVYRRYRDEARSMQVDLYVAYAARPAKMLGHRPEVCYPTHGWTPGEVRKDMISLADGRTFEYLVRTVSHGQRPSEQMVVLNYYILQGRYVTDWQDFWGPMYRMPNLSRDPSFYVAQVQVSAAVPLGASPTAVEAWVKELAALSAGPIRSLLPHPGA